MSETRETPDVDAAAAEKALDEAAEAVAVQAQEIEELTGGALSGDPIGLAHLMDVPVRVTVEVGHTSLTLADLFELGPGSLVTLDREAHEPADVLVNGKVVARGEVVTIDGSYGVRITSVVEND
jgi:flagellar motor switch protein FliN/FliY